jgi:hypothetical protein
MVGYESGIGSLGSLEDGPFFAYLRRVDAPVQAPNDLQMAPFAPLPSDLPLGQLAVTDHDPAGYTRYRVSIAFRLPSDLAAGRYGLVYCNATCTRGFGDLIGAVIFVGAVPDAPIRREWPLDEPEVANLTDEAILVGPGWETTAGAVRAGTPSRATPSSSPSPPTTPNGTTPATDAGDRSLVSLRQPRDDGNDWIPPTIIATVVIAVGIGLALGRRASHKGS